MKDFIKKMQCESDVGKQLLSDITHSVTMGRTGLSLTEDKMTPEKMAWLKDKDFTVQKEDDIHEYKISWN